MFDALLRGALAAVGLTELEAKQMIVDAFARINTIDARLARIERALNIRNVEEVTIEGSADHERDAAS